MWPGYLDLPELWERLGIGMDSSCIASLYRQSCDAGPYVHANAGLPLRFVREDGSLIDVLQQVAHLSDDIYCHPTLNYSLKYSAPQFDWVASRILEDAANRFHVPYCPVIHPWSYKNYSGEHGRAFMRHAQRLNLPIIPLDRWQNFWRAREQWRMKQYSRRDNGINFVLFGPACEGLFLTLPANFERDELKTLSCNGAPTEFEIVERFGRDIAQTALPEGATEVEVVAEYLR